MRITALLCVVVVLGASVAPAAAASTQSSTYAGTNVSFETNSNAVVDYAVGGTTMAQSIRVQSQSDAESGGLLGGGAGLSAVTHLDGSGLSLDSKTQTKASVKTDSGATLSAHDDGRGVLVVDAGGQSQYVTANVSSSGSAKAEGDGRVVVTADDGTEGTFLVVGDGSVTVNDAGNVAAELGSNGKLVFRSYPNGRSDADKQQERLISDGTAAAEVYVMPTAKGSSEMAADVVSYGEDTTVTVTQESEGTVKMTADRSSHEGRVIITTVSKQAISSTDGLRVNVDGEAAAKATSYSELRSAANGGDASKFLVRNDASAEASADVLVAVNHFSERQVTMSDNSSGSAGASGQSSTSGQPGFGVVVALLGLLAAAGLARFRS